MNFALNFAVSSECRLKCIPHQRGTVMCIVRDVDITYNDNDTRQAKRNFGCKATFLKGERLIKKLDHEEN